MLVKSLAKSILKQDYAVLQKLQRVSVPSASKLVCIVHNATKLLILR